MPENSLKLGDQLKDARAIRHLTLEDVEKETKVRLRHLEAIEEGHYELLPPDVFAIGFIRRYAKFLGLDPEVAVAMFRRERAERGVRKRSFSFRPPTGSKRPPFVLSTRFIVTALVVLVVLLLFGYIGWQIRSFAQPPQLVIETPVDNSTVTVSTVTMTGQTSPTANLFINGEAVPLDEQGRFRQDVKLTAGVNAIEVKAVNRLGKEKVEIIHILYEEVL